jgi:putative CocE/NonD family hydrolase
MIDQSSARPRYRTRVERDVPMKTRDGVVLRADVHRPDVDGNFPVLLLRTPYSKSGVRLREGEFYPPYGYLVVIQDSRGRYRSEGEFYPFADDGVDGYDAIEWAARLPGADGRVISVGQSYCALNQYRAAALRPPSLVGACPISGPVTLTENCFYRHGVMELGWIVPFCISMARETLTRRTDSIDHLVRLLDEMTCACDFAVPTLTTDAFRTLPLMALADKLDPIVPYFRDFIEHWGSEAFWDRFDLRNKFDQFNVPMFHIGSWYDCFQHDTLMMFDGLRKTSATKEARQAQKLLMGPWAHLPSFNDPTSCGTGDIDFGEAAEIELLHAQLAWFERLSGRPASPSYIQQAPVRIFVMGRNHWRDEQQWPPERARYTDFYLHGGGNANGSNGDGTLDRERPGDERPDYFVYDPDHPVPTRGGANVGFSMGVRDQTAIDRRPDILSYATLPLEHEIEVTGKVFVELVVASSAIDTDFTAKLIDVHPDGFAQNIVDGIVRARFRDSLLHPEPMEPGQPYIITIDLWSTSHVFLSGHRIRLDISSSNFPRFDRNLNGGLPLGTDTVAQIAHQTVFHDAARASRLKLPIIANN